MRYLILICISLGISGCGGYKTKYQASIDKQRKIAEQGAIEEVCKLRDRIIECYRDADTYSPDGYPPDGYPPDDMMDCAIVWSKRLHNITIKYGVSSLNVDYGSTPQEGVQHISINEEYARCMENSQDSYGINRCFIRKHEEKMKVSC